MNTRDPYDIVSLDDLKKKPAEEQRGYVPITERDEAALAGMTRQQRRKWMRENVKRLKRESGGAG